MKPTRRAILIVLSPPDMAPINPIRVRFDPMAELLPPHITLVFPFESDLSAGELRKHVQLAAEGVAPFAITLEGITGSEHEYLFLTLRRSAGSIVKIHTRLYSVPH